MKWDFHCDARSTGAKVLMVNNSGSATMCQSVKRLYKTQLQMVFSCINFQCSEFNKIDLSSHVMLFLCVSMLSHCEGCHMGLVIHLSASSTSLTLSLPFLPYSHSLVHCQKWSTNHSLQLYPIAFNETVLQRHMNLRGAYYSL